MSLAQDRQPTRGQCGCNPYHRVWEMLNKPTEAGARVSTVDA